MRPDRRSRTSRPSPDAEVVAHARHRKFSPAQNCRILKKAYRYSKLGEIGALMGREGIYSSSLHLAAPARRGRPGRAGAAKRCPKTDPPRADTLHIAALTRERDGLKRRLHKASLVIDVPKKAGRFAGQSDWQYRAGVMAKVHELPPALGASPACRVLGLPRASARRCAQSQSVAQHSSQVA